MVTYRGYKTTVYYVAEAAFGTPTTVTTPVEGKVQSVSTTMSNNLIRVTGLGEGRNETFVGFGNFEVSWEMTYNPSAFSFLQFGVGPQSGAGTTAAPYYLEEADFRGYTATKLFTFTMEIGSLDYTGGTHNVDTLTSCIINTIGITAEVGSLVSVSLTGYAQTVVSKATTPVTAALDTNKPWVFTQGAFKWNGSAIGRVQSFTVNINNNYDPSIGRGLGSRLVQEFEPGLRKYDWVAVVKMTDAVATSLRDHFYGTTNSPNPGVVSAEPVFYALILDLSEGAASTNRNAQVLLENCAINDISKPINIGDNIVEITINGTGKAGLTATTHKPLKWYTTT